MHIIAKTPPAKMLSAMKDGKPVEYADFSQLLYTYALKAGIYHIEEDGIMRFRYGSVVDFNKLRKEDKDGDTAFPVMAGMEYPSIALNPVLEDGDVRERGRLKFSADSLDFFSEDGQAGVSASNRVRGVVLHDILAGVYSPEDLGPAVAYAVRSGEITAAEASVAERLLRERIAQVTSRGWFPEDKGLVMNEMSLMDMDGQVYRPDRVIRKEGEAIIVDYKFGEHHPKYERQMKKYAQMWLELGVQEVSAYLWYVQTGEIVQVV